MALNGIIGVLMRERRVRIETQRHNGESHVKIEAEWELWSYKPRIAGSHQKLGERHETVSLSEPPEGTNLLTP